jgi:hypothetical protein
VILAKEGWLELGSESDPRHVNTARNVDPGALVGTAGSVRGSPVPGREAGPGVCSSWTASTACGCTSRCRRTTRPTWRSATSFSGGSDAYREKARRMLTASLIIALGMAAFGAGLAPAGPSRAR